MKKLLPLLLAGTSVNVLAGSNESTTMVANINAKYIASDNYLQNPYRTLTSRGGTQSISESQMIGQNFAERVFADGTWNVMVGAATQYTGTGAGYPNYAYGANLFGQTGSVAGFSVGGLVTVINPFFDAQMNGFNAQASPFLPSNEQVTLSQAYLEYRFSNIVQADFGYIAINNSPWLSGNYYNNVMSPGATYQGVLVNIYPGSGWLLTALAFNAAQAVSETGFTPLTFYNKGYDYAGGLIANNNPSGTSSGTTAFGASYAGWNNQYNLRLWGYQFDNYGTLLYADNSIKLQLTNTLSFNIAVQAGTDNQQGNASNAMTNGGFGQISSNFAGLQGTFNYSWFSLNVAYNNVWGPDSAYGNGAIVSPYTYGFATDPLYTTPYMAGLADLGTAGNAYRVSPTFNLLNGNLSIAPAYTIFNTAVSQWNGTQEYDFVASYNIPQIKGLTLFGVYAYQQIPDTNTNGSVYVTQLYVSYLY